MSDRRSTRTKRFIAPASLLFVARLPSVTFSSCCPIAGLVPLSTCFFRVLFTVLFCFKTFWSAFFFSFCFCLLCVSVFFGFFGLCFFHRFSSFFFFSVFLHRITLVFYFSVFLLRFSSVFWVFPFLTHIYYFNTYCSPFV